MNNLLNNRGFLEAPGFVLLLLMAIMIGVQAVVWQKRLQDTRAHHKQVLCLKKTILQTNQLIARVNSVNRMLSAGKVSQGIALFFPGTGWLLALNWEKAKKILMGLQEAAFLNYEKNAIQQRLSGCQFHLEPTLSPYKHKLFFSRKLDVAQLRKNKLSWRQVTPLMSFNVSMNLISPLERQATWRIE
ncbi:MAG: hypothetical protein K2P81_00045 [Bacteriovoracaceae bacterium]|nr:hypothetical protein [Bacteriovoracaceae bacterium]